MTNYGRYCVDDNGIVTHGTRPHQERIVTKNGRTVDRNIRYYPDGWQPYTEHEKFVVLVLAAHNACRSKAGVAGTVTALIDADGELSSVQHNGKKLSYDTFTLRKNLLYYNGTCVGRCEIINE